MSQHDPSGIPGQVPPPAAPQQPAPQYSAPQYAAPQYAAPQYAAPQYSAPQYSEQQPSTEAPQQPAYPGAAQPYAAAGQPYAVPTYVPVATTAPPTNTLSILALVSAFVAPFVVPVVLGHLGLSQIRRTGEGGRGLAVTALVLGYIQVAFWAILIAFIVWIGVVAAAGSSM